MTWTSDGAHVIGIFVAEADRDQNVETAGDPDAAADVKGSGDRHLGVVLQGVDDEDQAVYSNHTQGDCVDHC